MLKTNWQGYLLDIIILCILIGMIMSVAQVVCLLFNAMFGVLVI